MPTQLLCIVIIHVFGGMYDNKQNLPRSLSVVVPLISDPAVRAADLRCVEDALPYERTCSWSFRSPRSLQEKGPRAFLWLFFVTSMKRAPRVRGARTPRVKSIFFARILTRSLTGAALIKGRIRRRLLPCEVGTKTSPACCATRQMLLVQNRLSVLPVICDMITW